MPNKTTPELPLDDEADEAVKAFEALRKSIDKRGTATAGELKAIRKGVEALFDQVEALQAKPDYAEDLGRVTKGIVIVAERLKALEATPLLHQGVEHHARLLERTGESLVKTAAQSLEQKAQRLEAAAHTFERMVQGAHDRRRQTWYLAGLAGLFFLVGALSLLFLPRLLPFDADSHVAAAVMGKSRWDAGAAIMHAANPTGWEAVTESAQLGQDNAEVLGRCRQAAAKSGQAQKCTLKVTPAAR